jgi:hypothetical protein
MLLPLRCPILAAEGDTPLQAEATLEPLVFFVLLTAVG